MHIEEKHLTIIKNILHKYPYSFYAFGSRVTGKARRFSDLDLCCVDDIPKNQILEIEEAFEESNLPYKVDLVNWNNCSQEFQRIISHDMVLLEK